MTHLGRDTKNPVNGCFRVDQMPGPVKVEHLLNADMILKLFTDIIGKNAWVCS
jgi:hypothetical protein